MFPSFPFRLTGAFAASTGSETKLRFSLRLEASVQSGICGCMSVKTNLTASLVLAAVRGDRGVRTLMELADVVNGELGSREDN